MRDVVTNVTNHVSESSLERGPTEFTCRSILSVIACKLQLHFDYVYHEYMMQILSYKLLLLVFPCSLFNYSLHDTPSLEKVGI